MALKGFLQGEHEDLGSGYNSGLATKGAQYSNALHSGAEQWYIIWKSRGGIMVNGVPREVPRHSIHHDTPKAFPYNVILSASRTSKEGFLSLAPNPTCA